ncbi:alpha/beta-hydrolase [Hymenopellis radicata]|nr:alpha/beta-hydrolase [Hymenopellis radicata]
MPKRDTHPYTIIDPSSVPGIEQVSFRARLPLESPPPFPASSLPRLPSCKPRPKWLPEGWSHSTHIIPAAYPRSSGEVELPARPKFDPGRSKAERMQDVRRAHARLLQLRNRELLPARNEKVLWICADRYVRSRESGNGLTLFFAHANGLSKETWDPTISRVLDARTGRSISEVWVWDAVNHGDSYILNDGKLNMMFHWHESVRDLLNFLVYYLPSGPVNSLPLHLPRLRHSESADRLEKGFRLRKIIAVGHSFGGTICTLAALSHPVLFSSLILIDPIIVYPVAGQQAERHFEKLTLGALSRRDTWKDEQEARVQMSSLPLFQRWDPDVLDAYFEHGLRHVSEGNVTLKTPAIQEAVTFSDTWTGCEEAWVRLFRGELDERVALMWIVPGKGEEEVAGPGKTRPRVWLRRKECVECYD